MLERCPGCGQRYDGGGCATEQQLRPGWGVRGLWGAGAEALGVGWGCWARLELRDPCALASLSISSASPCLGLSAEAAQGLASEEGWGQVVVQDWQAQGVWGGGPVEWVELRVVERQTAVTRGVRPLGAQEGGQWRGGWTQDPRGGGRRAWIGWGPCLAHRPHPGQAVTEHLLDAGSLGAHPGPRAVRGYGSSVQVSRSPAELCASLG